MSAIYDDFRVFFLPIKTVSWQCGRSAPYMFAQIQRYRKERRLLMIFSHPNSIKEHVLIGGGGSACLSVSVG